MSNKHILTINRFDSNCNNCLDGADPTEKEHNIVVGYSKREKGCGVKWTHVTSDYSGQTQKESVMKMRPDLTWIDPISGDEDFAVMENMEKEAGI